MSPTKTTVPGAVEQVGVVANEHADAAAFPAEGLGGPKSRPVTYGQFQDGVRAILDTVGAAAPAAFAELTMEGPLIYAKLAAVLADMPAVPKGQTNQGQGFAYQGIEDILAQLKPILARHGVFYVPTVLQRIAEARQTRNNTTLWTVHLCVRYRFYAADGSFVSAVTWGEGTDSGDKATAKAMTMAMKACLRQVLAIPDNEIGDPDGETAEASDPMPVPEPLADADRQAIQQQIDGLSETAAARLKELWIAKRGSLPSLRQASAEHVPAILALIAEADSADEPVAETEPPA